MAKANKMIEDPIVEEVRRHRLARAARFNFDIKAIAEDARTREGTGGHEVIQPKQKRRPRRGARSHG